MRGASLHLRHCDTRVKRGLMLFLIRIRCGYVTTAPSADTRNCRFRLEFPTKSFTHTHVRSRQAIRQKARIADGICTGGRMLRLLGTAVPGAFVETFTGGWENLLLLVISLFRGSELARHDLRRTTYVLMSLTLTSRRTYRQGCHAVKGGR
jgi:hypothetical protein